MKKTSWALYAGSILLLTILYQFIPVKFIWCKGQAVTLTPSPETWRWCAGNFSGMGGVNYNETTLYLMSCIYAFCIVSIVTALIVFYKKSITRL